MQHRRLIVLTILIYVTLDLSLPSMPGAFVFEPADSAESTQVRARAAADTFGRPTMARAPGFVLFQPPLEDNERLAPGGSAERIGRPRVSWPPRAQYDSAPASEDPH